jgi:hypothetical protein
MRDPANDVELRELELREAATSFPDRILDDAALKGLEREVSDFVLGNCEYCMDLSQCNTTLTASTAINATVINSKLVIIVRFRFE